MTTVYIVIASDGYDVYSDDSVKVVSIDHGWEHSPIVQDVEVYPTNDMSDYDAIELGVRDE